MQFSCKSYKFKIHHTKSLKPFQLHIEQLFFDIKGLITQCFEEAVIAINHFHLNYEWFHFKSPWNTFLFQWIKNCICMLADVYQHQKHICIGFVISLKQKASSQKSDREVERVWQSCLHERTLLPSPSVSDDNRNHYSAKQHK